MMNKISKIIDLLTKITIISSVFFISVYFSIFLKNNDVFEVNKILLFKILTLFILLLTIIEIIINNKIKNLNIKNCKIFIIPLLLITSFTISTFISDNLLNSFFGSYNRLQGLSSYLFYFLFFILLILNIKNKKDVNNILIAVALSSFFVCLYGLAQAIGLDFRLWDPPTTYLGRINSTIGQPNYLASYLLLIIPITAYLFLKFKNFILKFLIFLLFISQIVCLFFTYSRAGWLGLLAEIFVFFIFYLLILKKKYNIKIKPIYFITSIVFIFLLILSFYNLNLSFKYRVNASFNLNSGSQGIRMKFWLASLDAIKKRPVFGYGLDNLSDVFVKYYKKDWPVNGFVNDYPDRAHNIILDSLLFGGIIGLILYLALLYLFYKLAIKNILEKKEPGISLAIIIGVSGYLVSLLFGFSIVVTNIYFWLYFALIVLYSKNRHLCHFDPELVKGEKSLQQANFTLKRFLPRKMRDRNDKKFFILKNIISVILIILISIFIFFQINKEFKTFIADYYYRQLLESAVKDKYVPSFTLFNYIKELNIRDDYYKTDFSRFLVKWVDYSNDFKIKELSRSELIKILAGLKNENFSNLKNRAIIKTALAKDKNDEYLMSAEEDFKKLIEISPEMPKIYEEMGRMYFKKEELENAKNSYNKALENLPDINNPEMNEEHRSGVRYEKYIIFESLAAVYLYEKNYDKAISYYKLAAENYTNDNALNKRIADAYYYKGDIEMAIWYNKRGMVRSPYNSAWPLNVAQLYKEKGDKVMALEYAKKALELDKENEQIKKFIKELK